MLNTNKILSIAKVVGCIASAIIIGLQEYQQITSANSNKRRRREQRKKIRRDKFND